MTDFIAHVSSPFGGITLASEGAALTGLWFDGQKYFGDGLGNEREEKDLPVFAEARRWLDLYFAGSDPGFTPPLCLCGTPFRKAVWKILLTVPYGQTITYKAIADRLAEQQGLSRMSAQAVGSAVGHNPISLIVPCHRVLGADGSLTGYAAGLEIKQKLLQMEQR